jgi:hypothetical protein
VLQFRITTFVPSNSVKEILVQPDSEGKKVKWIVKLLEYDLQINPTKMIKGKELAKLLSVSLRIHLWIAAEVSPVPSVCMSQ